MRAECCWGAGIDVMLITDKSFVKLEKEIQMDLSLQEAKKLVVQLQNAILQCESLNTMCKEHDEQIK